MYGKRQSVDGRGKVCMVRDSQWTGKGHLLHCTVKMLMIKGSQSVNYKYMSWYILHKLIYYPKPSIKSFKGVMF